MAKKVYRAGVIPYYQDSDQNIQMMFMLPSNKKFGGDVFQIAKGKAEDGESMKEAGLREANEELGLFVGNIETLTKVGVFMGRTTIYIALIKDVDMFGDPVDETERVEWMTLEQFQEVGRELHKPVVKSAHRLMKKVLSSTN
jgi:8-oxo-dGTP pyrophosphatase MutT (NUDIX family)